MSSFYSTPGPAGTIQVGTVTTGAAGSNAAVTNSGTVNAAIFNFTIPRGDTGAAAAAGAGTAALPSLTFSGDTNTGFYNPSADTLGFTTGGVVRAFLDASGRLLLGANHTTSTDLNTPLQVRNDSGFAVQFFRSSSDATGPGLTLTKSRGTAAAPTEVSSGDELGTIRFRGYDGAAWQTGVYIQGRASASWTDAGDTTDNPGALYFGTVTDGSDTLVDRVMIDGTDQPLKEVLSGIYYPVVTQADIGSGANQVPLNGMLGSMAFQDAEGVTVDRGVVQGAPGGAAQETPLWSITGPWFTGGTSTTTKPELLIEPLGTTSTNWSTSGTGFGINAPSGFAGNLLDLQVNGVRRAVIKSTGVLNLPNLPTYATDSAAATGGLVAGDVYKTSTGELRIKL